VRKASVFGDLLLAPRINHTDVRHHDDVRRAAVGQS
jgi:hypothetical protein